MCMYEYLIKTSILVITLIVGLIILHCFILVMKFDSQLALELPTVEAV